MSTRAIEVALRDRLLTFTRLAGDQLDQLLGSADGSGQSGKLYRDRAPDNVTGPYGVMSLRNRRADMENPERELAELEVQLYVKNWANRATLTDAADACDEAMLGYRSSSDDSGFIGVIGKQRSALAPMKEPADSDMVTILCVYTLVLWPANLIQYNAQ